MSVQAPFPYFGGKRKAAALIWHHLGDVKNYCEPFCGSAAVLLNRPHKPKIETVNDLDGLLVNAWRGIKLQPEQTAYYADWPVTEIDLNARHAWLKAQRKRITTNLKADPDWCDPKAAGWWVWGCNLWIGRQWCYANKKQLPHLGAQIPHLGNAGTGVHKPRLPHLGAQIPHLGNAGRGVHKGSLQADGIHAWFNLLSDRLRRTRIITGDWRRTLTPSVTTKHGLTGVFLDPPYNSERVGDDFYAHGDTHSIADDVRDWCANADPAIRIVLAGYQGDHDQLLNQGWQAVPWQNSKGYQSVKDGTHSGQREVLYVSPNCVGSSTQKGLF